MKFAGGGAEAEQGSHSPHGECGLKLSRDSEYSEKMGHSPHGECGLKSKRST